jgi:hypothetical protein
MSKKRNKAIKKFIQQTKSFQEKQASGITTEPRIKSNPSPSDSFLEDNPLNKLHTERKNEGKPLESSIKSSSTPKTKPKITLVPGSVPMEYKNEWSQYLTFLFYSALTKADLIDPSYIKFPKIGFMCGSNNWANYNHSFNQLQISEELILNYPFYITEAFALHEFVHYYLYQIDGKGGYLRPGVHSQEFKRIGEIFNIHPFYLTDDVESKELTPNPVANTVEPPVDADASGVLAKVRKLMALSKSTVAAEADAALAAASNIMAKHNIKSLELDSKIDKYVYQRVAIPSYVQTAEIGVISSILFNFFFVHVVSCSTINARTLKPVTYIEITGKPENVLFADYVYNFVLERLKTFWQNARSLHHFSGKTLKKSFQFSVLKGLYHKLEEAAYQENKKFLQEKKNYSDIVLHKNPGFTKYLEKRYGNSIKSTLVKYTPKDLLSSHVGYEYGKTIDINRPLNEGEFNESPINENENRFLPEK